MEYSLLDQPQFNDEAKEQAEIWLAFKVLKPLCYELLSHQTKTTEQNNLLESRLRVLASEVSQLPKRGVTACTDYLALPLIALLRFYSISLTHPGSYDDETIGSGIDRVIEALLTTLSVFFNQTTEINNDLFLKCFQALLKLIDIQIDSKSSSNNTTIIKNDLDTVGMMTVFSEEIRKSILNCFDGLFRVYRPNKTEDNLLNDPKILPSLAFIVYRLLDVAVKDRNRKNQATSLKTISTFFDCISNLHMLSNLIPGILTSLTRIIMGDYKQGKDVFVAAFQLLSKIIVKTLSDSTNPNLAKDITNTESAMDMLRNMAKNPSKPKNEPKTLNINEQNESGFLLPKRDEQWFKNASYHVHQVLTRIYSISRLTAEEQSKNVSMTLIIFKNHEIRLEMAKTGLDIALHCQKTLSTTIPSLFEIMILFSLDDQPEVAQFCEDKLNLFASILSQNNQSTSLQLRQILSENLSKLIISLTRIIRNPDDNKKVLVLRLVAGYVRLLARNLQSALTTIMPKLATALISILDLDYSDIRLAHKKTAILMIEPSEAELNSNQRESPENIASSALYQLQQTYRNNFLHFRDDRVYYAIIHLLRNIGAFCNLENLFDHFMPIITSQSIQSDFEGDKDDDQVNLNQDSRYPQAVMILNEFVLGAAGFLDPSSTKRYKLDFRRPKEFKGQLDHLLNFYLSDEVYPMKQIEQDDWKDGSIVLRASSTSKDLFLMTFLLEGIGNMAMLFGTQFNTYLMKTLYPILQVLGSSSSILGHNAKLTLTRLYVHTGNKDIISLIRSNTDFIVDSIVHEMKYAHDLGSGLNVLQGVLNVASSLMIPLLDDLLDEIFKGLDERHDDYNIRFLAILHAVVVVVSKQEYKSPDQIRRENRIKYRKLNPTKDNTTKSTTTEKNIVEDYTLHNWIRRCELQYLNNSSGISNSSTAPNIEKDEENESELTFSMNDFLKSRIKSRVEEERAFSGSQIDEEIDTSEMKHKSAKEFFMDHHQKKMEDEALGKDKHEDAKVEDEDIESDEEYEEDRDGKLIKKPHRPGYDFVHKILLKLQHWMSIRSLEARIVVLDTIKVGIKVLSEHKKILLPVIHTLWSPLQWRFLDSDYRIVNKALEIMEMMSIHGKDFVTRRYLDDLWPLLKNIITLYNVHTSVGQKNIAKLNMETQYSDFVSSETTFQMSQSYKTQVACLNSINNALQHLKLPAPILEDIQKTCWFYLSELQPPVVQELATTTFRLIHTLDPNNSWLLLYELSHADLNPPKDIFKYLHDHLDIDLPTIHPLITVAPFKFRKSQFTLSNFYAQFHKNASQILYEASSKWSSIPKYVK